MANAKHIFVALLLSAFLLVGCKGVPDYVIPPSAMADLLADLYTAEAISEMRRGEFADDSMRRVLRQSVYMRHGVTASQVDTSFMWYGHNLDKYIEIHDKTIALLEDRMNHTSLGAGGAFGMAGDSVDVWTAAREYLITQRSPSRVLSFELIPDENCEPGDRYTWAVKSLNSRTPASWMLAADYSDSSTEFNNGQITGEGWTRIQLLTDTMRQLVRVYGYLLIQPSQGEEVYLDSIQLVRRRVDEATYRQRYRQHSFGRGKYNPQTSDSVTSSAPAPTHQAPPHSPLSAPAASQQSRLAVGL